MFKAIHLSLKFPQLCIWVMMVLFVYAHGNLSSAAEELLSVNGDVTERRIILYPSAGILAKYESKKTGANCSDLDGTHIIRIAGLGTAYCRRCSCEEDEQCRVKCTKC